jgi:alpha-glucosidase
LEHVPTIWVETKVLNGEIGDYITVARKSGDEWYVGSMTDENARVLNAPLNFLSSGNYVAYIYSDGSDAHYLDNPKPVDIKKVIVNSSDTITASLTPANSKEIEAII